MAGWQRPRPGPAGWEASPPALSRLSGLAGVAAAEIRSQPCQDSVEPGAGRPQDSLRLQGRSDRRLDIAASGRSLALGRNGTTGTRQRRCPAQRGRHARDRCGDGRIEALQVAPCTGNQPPATPNLRP